MTVHPIWKEKWFLRDRTARMVWSWLVTHKRPETAELPVRRGIFTVLVPKGCTYLCFSSLGRELDLHPQTIKRSVLKLESEGWIRLERRTELTGLCLPMDRRYHIVHFTKDPL